MLIITRTDYRKTVIEINDIFKHLYTDHEIQQPRERQQAPVLHNNISTYAQTLTKFYEANPILTTSSNKRLKIQFQEDTLSSK